MMTESVSIDKILKDIIARFDIRDIDPRYIDKVSIKLPSGERKTITGEEFHLLFAQNHEMASTALLSLRFGEIGRAVTAEVDVMYDEINKLIKERESRKNEE
jgi:hypothetical protein